MFYRYHVVKFFFVQVRISVLYGYIDRLSDQRLLAGTRVVSRSVSNLLQCNQQSRRNVDLACYVNQSRPFRSVQHTLSKNYFTFMFLKNPRNKIIQFLSCSE